MNRIAPLATLCVLALSTGCTATPAPTTAPTGAGTPIETTIVPGEVTPETTPVATETSPTAETTSATKTTSATTQPASTTSRATSSTTAPKTGTRPSTRPTTASTSTTKSATKGATKGTAGNPGSWTPSCSSAAADARKLTDEVLAQPDLDAATVRKSTNVLLRCPAVHTLAVRKQIAGADASATMIRTGIDATLRSAPMSLSGGKVGRFTVGQTPMADALPVLKAVLGQPDRVEKSSCELSGGAWETLHWKGFTVGFDANAKGKPVNYWQITRRQGQPANLKLVNGLEVGATLADVKKVNPRATLSPLFGNDEYPMVADAAKGLWFIWDTKTAPSDAVIGGNLNLCD